ncbi:hypothetical protein [Janibacter sp. GXQ6167]|uniref:hypothetical protein n=1 Tax=Janibacter sp. GXQ6167 TaxID=3240791 RepID=UPI003524F3F9
MADVSRRRLTTGLAWSVPVIAVGAAAPAFAASRCIPQIGLNSQVKYNWGTWVQGRDTPTNQVLTLERTYILVRGLHQSVDVQSAKITYYVERRNGQTSRGPGIFYLGNQTASVPALQDQGPGDTPGWSGPSKTPVNNLAATSANNLANVVYTQSAGTTFVAPWSWSMTFSWDLNPTKTNVIEGEPTPQVCRSVDTSRIGGQNLSNPMTTLPYVVTYSDVLAIEPGSADRNFHVRADISVTLSDGTTLQQQGAGNWWIR